eukprot:scaffold1883_cov396-Prasinococcus_capsulatus_cf.AAC.7
MGKLRGRRARGAGGRSSLHESYRGATCTWARKGRSAPSPRPPLPRKRARGARERGGVGEEERNCAKRRAAPPGGLSHTGGPPAAAPLFPTRPRSHPGRPPPTGLGPGGHGHTHPPDPNNALNTVKKPFNPSM